MLGCSTHTARGAAVGEVGRKIPETHGKPRTHSPKAIPRRRPKGSTSRAAAPKLQTDSPTGPKRAPSCRQKSHSLHAKPRESQLQVSSHRKCRYSKAAQTATKSHAENAVRVWRAIQRVSPKGRSMRRGFTVMARAPARKLTSASCQSGALRAVRVSQ